MFYPYFRQVNISLIREEDDDTQYGIDQDQLLLEQTLHMIELTPSRDSRDITTDVTLFSEIIVEVRNCKAKSVHFFILYFKELQGKLIGQYAYHYLGWYLQTYIQCQRMFISLVVKCHANLMRSFRSTEPNWQQKSKVLDTF